MRTPRLSQVVLALAGVRARSLALAGVAALAAGGCDWRDFDTIEAQAPVRSISAPSHFGADDFGRTLLPLSGLPAGATGSRFVVSGAATSAIALIDIDAKGATSGVNVTSPNFVADQPITSLAEVPGTNQVLLGAPPSGVASGTVYVMTLGQTSDVAVLDSPGLSDRFGLGVAAGTLAGTAAPDFVVASGSDLTVYVDGLPPGVSATMPGPDCPMLISTSLASRDRVRRAVLVDSLLGDATSQIVVGTPAFNDAGAVSVFTVDPSGVATCAFTYRKTDARFGHALATGDFDGDGHRDLLIGSPPAASGSVGHAFWIRGPLTPTSAILPVTLAPGGSELGASVAAGNLDGKPGDEAIIGDQDAVVGGATRAGEVRLVGGTMLDQELPLLRRHDAAANDAFGIDVGALRFCRAGCGTATADVKSLVLAGSSSRATVYFQLAPGDADPRTK